MVKIDGKELKLSLAMIVKDETDTLVKSLKSVRPYVDEIVVAWNGNNPETEKILKEYDCVIVPYVWENDFAKAREFSFSKASGNLLTWLDADDEYIGGDKLVSSCEKAFCNPLIGSLWFKWHYDHDKFGNVRMVLWRERVVRKGWFEWKGRLHETLIQKVDCEHAMCDDLYVKHNATSEQIDASANRNLKILIDQYKKEHKENNIDAKTIFDLGRSLDAIGKREEALGAFLEYIPLSGWDDDKYTAYIRIADICRYLGKFEDAASADLTAQKLKPLIPDAYLGLAMTAYQTEKYQECVQYIHDAMSRKAPMGIMPCDPIKYEGEALQLLHRALFRMGNSAEAEKIANKALRYYPDDKDLLKWIGIYQKFNKQRETEKAVLWMVQELKEEKQVDKLSHLVKAIPDYMSDHPVLIRLKNEHEKPDGKNRIQIFCGPTFELWSPSSVNSGIGGSEEAVINIGNELNKLGYTVDVYNACDITGNYDGVCYHNYWEHDRKAPCDIFIAWRMAEFVKLAPEGSRVFLWLHDIQKYDYYNPTTLGRIDKIFALSKYHRNNLPEIPDDKFYITKNGILLDQFNKEVEKDPYRCIYVSSPDRGLFTLLEMWPEIKKAVPEATLHIYYGFTKTYDMLHADDDNMRIYKERCMEMMRQPGVVYHGRVGHKELAEDMLKSALWLYPTQFQEIFCISATKCQAAKVLPITTTVAALNETVKFGVKLPYNDIYSNKQAQEQFVNLAIKYLQNPKLREAAMNGAPEWVAENYTWEAIAKDWKEKAFNAV